VFRDHLLTQAKMLAEASAAYLRVVRVVPEQSTSFVSNFPAFNFHSNKETGCPGSWQSPPLSQNSGIKEQ